MSDRDPPTFAASTLAALDAEHSVIGALLLDNTAFDRIGDLLLPVHFFNPLHGEIYAEIASQINACRQCDVVTIGLALQGKVDMSELNAMAQFVPSAANARRYALAIVERFKSRQLLVASGEIAELAQDHARPIADRLDAAQAQLTKLADTTPRDDWLGVDASMAAALDVLQARADGHSNAMPTGLGALDNYLEGGIRPGQLVIVGARPSMGKTALALTVALNMARDYAVGMLSMEMPHAEVDDRMLAVLGKVSLSALKRPKVGGLDWDRVTEAVEKARTLNFFKSDHAGLTINQVRTKARTLKRLHGLNVLIVDYIGLMTGTDTRQPRAYQLEEISRGLKTLAKELDIAVICLAQVNRKVEERGIEHPPALSDLRDSGAIEQDADVVTFVHRPIQARPDMGEEWKYYAKLSIAKNRNGPCGVISLSYVGEQTRFAGWEGPPPTTRTKFGGDL
jgi:replicative DNA helicase